MPHYLIDRLTYDAVENRCVLIHREAGAIVAASLRSAKRLAELRYYAKTGAGLRYYQRLELRAVREARHREYVEKKQHDDLKAAADFAELMQVILGVRPVPQTTDPKLARE